MVAARDIITAVVAEKYGMPVCDKCGQAFIFDQEEPFAECGCCTSEWGHSGDPFRLMQAKLLGYDMGLNRMQRDMLDWVRECFGFDSVNDVRERNFRFIEEAIELVQSTGCEKEHVLQMVEYVYSRPEGSVPQEFGGVMVTLLALANSCDLNLKAAAKDEIARIWQHEVMGKIQLKNLTKPLRSGPLPGKAELKAAMAPSGFLLSITEFLSGKHRK